jgi:hypothetical protein
VIVDKPFGTIGIVVLNVMDKGKGNVAKSYENTELVPSDVPAKIYLLTFWSGGATVKMVGLIA